MDASEWLTFAISVVLRPFVFRVSASLRTSVGRVIFAISPTDIFTYIMNSWTPAKLDVLKKALLNERTFFAWRHKHTRGFASSLRLISSSLPSWQTWHEVLAPLSRLWIQILQHQLRSGANPTGYVGILWYGVGSHFWVVSGFVHCRWWIIMTKVLLEGLRKSDRHSRALG